MLVFLEPVKEGEHNATLGSIAGQYTGMCRKNEWKNLHTEALEHFLYLFLGLFIDNERPF